MSKKILKRRLVMGALMAFIITGNAWAENTTKYNNYFLPAGDFDNVKVAADKSDSIGGKHTIVAAGKYKLYSNLNAYSEDKDNPNKLEMSGPIYMSTTDAYNRFNIYAGYASDKNSINEADNNLFVIEHNLTVYDNCELYGGIFSYVGDDDERTISGNWIIVDSATLKTTDDYYLQVIGGLAQGSNLIAEDNHVKIKNVVFDTNNAQIIGAESRYGVSAKNNQVEIIDTEIKSGFITGGRIRFNTEAQANGNSVTIDGNSKISCDVYAGYNVEGMGTASDNSINIKGNADVSEARLHGDKEGVGTGNTLNLETGWNGVIGSADNFNVINVGEGVEATFKAPIVANEQNTVINIGKDDGEDINEEDVKESLLIGQIITDETSGSSSLNFINGGAWKVTGKSKVSDLQGDSVTINVYKVEEDLVTITNGVKDNQTVVLKVTDDDLGVDVTEGVQTMVDTVVDGNGKSVFEKITDEEIDLKATVDATVSEDGSVQNVTTAIKPGDKFVVESDVEVSGELKATDVFASDSDGVLVGLKDTAKQVEINKIAIAELEGAYKKADKELQEGIDANTFKIEENKTAIAENKAAIEAEIDRATKAEAALQEVIDVNTAKIEKNTTAIAENKVAIEAEIDRATKAEVTLQGNDITSGAINHESGTITLTRNNGTEFELEGELCDSRLDTVSYDAKTGKMTFTIKDHYNQDKDNSIVVDDIASKVALEKEISDRILADDIEKQERIAGDNMLNSKLNQLGSKVNKVGAGAAALAALHPLDFDPDDKLSFSAGVGNYAGENAAALGMFYRPNEKVMLSMGGTVGSDEEMVNLGISFALDKPNNVSNSRVAMAKELITLREHIANQDVRLAKQDEQIAQLVMLVKQLTGKNIEFKAEPIEELSKDGSIRIERLTDGYEEYDRVRIK